jgi:hypothetical protein
MVVAGTQAHDRRVVGEVVRDDDLTAARGAGDPLEDLDQLRQSQLGGSTTAFRVAGEAEALGRSGCVGHDASLSWRSGGRYWAVSTRHSLLRARRRAIMKIAGTKPAARSAAIVDGDLPEARAFSTSTAEVALGSLSATASGVKRSCAATTRAPASLRPDTILCREV